MSGYFMAVKSAIAKAISSFAAPGGSAAVGFMQAGAGAVQRTVQDKLRDIVNVKDFGAKGDGVTDDTAAIQAAINHATTNFPTAIVLFPPNLPSQYYKTTAPISITKPVTLRGSGITGTTIIAVGLSAGQYVIDCDNAVSSAYSYNIENMTVWSSSGAANGIHLRNCSYSKITNVWARNCAYGCVIEGTIAFSNFFDNFVGYAISGSTVRITNFTGGGQYKFDKCTFGGGTGFAMDSNSLIDSLNFTNCNFEQCVTESLYIGGTVNGLSFVGCRTEGLDGAIDFQINPTTGNIVEGLTITGCNFTTDNGASIPIYLGGAGGKVRGFNITGNSVGYAGIGASFVYLNGEGESGLIAGNYFSQSNTTPINAARAGVVVFGNENANGKCAEYWGQADWGIAQGTWTPTDGSGAALSISGGGRWTKIGRTVFWQLAITYPTTSSSASASIDGLPYAVGGVTGDTSGRSGAVVNMTNYGSAIGIFQGSPAATKLQFFNQVTGVTLTNANLSGKYIYCSGTYTL